MKKATKKTILLIEDDLPTIDVYETAFKQAKFEIETISWGQDAVKRVKEIQEGKAGKPDIVLLDLILPDMNGLQVLEEIRKQEKTKNLPVFILTNYTSQELAKMGYDLVIEKYLTKTEYPPSQLVKVIKERLK